MMKFLYNSNMNLVTQNKVSMLDGGEEKLKADDSFYFIFSGKEKDVESE